MGYIRAMLDALKPKETQTARLWSYVRNEDPWFGDAPPCAWYQFSTDRKGEHPANHLSGYTGTVHADGFAGFYGLFGEGEADEQACLVRVRRKFVDAFERTGADIVKHTITQITELYAVEKEASRSRGMACMGARTPARSQNQSHRDLVLWRFARQVERASR